MSKFSQRLKELRLESGLTQTQLSEKTHISQTAISGYEAGKNRPTDIVIIILCRFFQVSSDYLLGLVD